MASSWSRASSPSWGATLGPSSSPQSRCSPVLAQEQNQVLLGGEQGQEGPHGTGGVGTAPPAHSAESEGFDKHLCHPSTGDKSLQGPGLGLGLLLFVFVLIPRSPVHPPKPGPVCCHCYCSPCYQGRMMGTGTGTGGAARAAEGGWGQQELELGTATARHSRAGCSGQFVLPSRCSPDLAGRAAASSLLSNLPVELLILCSGRDAGTGTASAPPPKTGRGSVEKCAKMFGLNFRCFNGLLVTRGSLTLLQDEGFETGRK